MPVSKEAIINLQMGQSTRRTVPSLRFEWRVRSAREAECQSSQLPTPTVGEGVADDR
jgi:hypothetical protein